MKCAIPIFLVIVLFACNQPKETIPLPTVNWDKRSATPSAVDSLTKGSTYLSVYSEIYQVTENRTYHLTVTVSMRNISSADTVYILNAKHYNTKGDLIRTYFDKPIFIAPLETVEIVINEGDKEGGTGGNFVFEWASPTIEPHFEAVMISTTGQQGLSFTTQGIKR
ncbi:MAG: DUF3124 domain-containing protein [Cyclobacteriaceae bacterium]|jgi:hypothetical protein|nr:DUF3124 domain-containing protein [Cyclobacteriaceae bacterium]